MYSLIPLTSAGSGSSWGDLLPLENLVDEAAGPAGCTELALERVGVVEGVDPLGEGHGPMLVILQVLLEEAVEDAGVRLADMAVAQRQLRLGLLDRRALPEDAIERAHEAD